MLKPFPQLKTGVYDTNAKVLPPMGATLNTLLLTKEPVYVSSYMIMSRVVLLSCFFKPYIAIKKSYTNITDIQACS